MKIKEEKGVTLAALVAIIVILLILSSIGINSGITTIKSSNFSQFKNELKVLQTKVNELNQDNEYEIEQGLTEEQKSILNTPTISDIIYNGKTAEEKINIQNGFRYCSKDYLKTKFNFDSIKRDYFINVKYRYVICKDGVEYDGKVYYMINQMEDGLYNVDYNNKNVDNGSFDVVVTYEGDKHKMEVKNIQYDGYVDKWQVKYKLEGSTYWETSDDLTFYVKKTGIYNVKVVHRDEIDLGTKTAKTLMAGDYIDYIPDDKTSSPYLKSNLTSDKTGSSSNSEDIKQDNLKWQILKINEDGSMDLIGSPTSQNVYFNGVAGYNNGVNIMNDICENLYSRGSIKARSVNIDDFENWLTEAGKTARAEYSNYTDGPKYGHTQTYTTNSYYPNLYYQELGAKINSGITEQGIDKETGNTTGLKLSDEGTATGSTKASTLTTTQTFYAIGINSANYGDGAKALKKANDCWVASRYVYCLSDFAGFGLRFVGSSFGGDIMLLSYYGTNNIHHRLCPVVSLESNVQIITSATASSESGTPHTITQY